MKKCTFLGAVACAAVGLSAHAGIDFVTQTPDAVNGYFADSTGSSPAQRIADNFVSQASWNIEYMSFWGGYFPNNTPVTDAFTIEFRADNGGLPGAVVHTTTPASLVRTATGIVIFGVDEYRYDVVLAAPVSLGAGTFWVSVTNSTNFGSSSSWFWETSSAGGNQGSWSPDSGGTWNGLPNDLSMILGGSVPAPGALALLGAAGLVARRRRRA
ncbi:MAG: hypothetical protein HRU76_12920 [Phycisphaeraceae bacterium]|nr:hypothetical protein [Phycisphaerales bacterium]QOJ18434.1 MAG: hypothetical protein HRU76_12920 [Phycisphaeraceae bacterium]